MLVLSRREQESIVFPKLGIRIEVARLRGKAVSLGIEAPDAVRILRGEIATPDDFAADDPSEFATAYQQHTAAEAVDRSPADRQREHDLRNRVNTLTIALHLLKKKASREDGLVDDHLLSDAIDELALIEETLQDTSTPPDLDQVAKKANLPMALIVDDNENENALMAGFLRQCGFRVTIAQDGDAALRLIRQASKLPDVVLLDMNMPKLDGRGTIEAIRTDPRTRQLPVFAVSGEDQQQSNVPVGDDGVDRWFRKPVRPDFLVQEISKGLSRVTAC